MNRRVKKVVMLLLLALSLSTIAGQSVSAGTPVRCGAACYTNIIVPPPPDS